MTSPQDHIESHVRVIRRAAGLTQDELARRCRISRQTLIAIEAGRTQPSVAIALRLASALGQQVEELFRPADMGSDVEAELAAPVPRARAGDPPARVALAHIGDRWVAHPIGQDDPVGPACAADGVLLAGARDAPGPRGSRPKRARVEPLRPAAQLGDNLFVVGCDPALGLLADRIRDRGCRMIWLHAASHAALEMLARGHTHIAGAHLFDEGTGEFNVPFVRRMFAPADMHVVTMASWELGLVVQAALRKRVRGIADLLQPGVRFVHREPGAEARALVERLLRRAGAPADALARAPVARGHLAVARTIATGGADAGVATRASAHAHGLAFVPLAEERFDLVIPRALLHDPRVMHLVDTLKGQPFRRELGCLRGYQTRQSGDDVPA